MCRGGATIGSTALAHPTCTAGAVVSLMELKTNMLLLHTN